MMGSNVKLRGDALAQRPSSNAGLDDATEG